MKPSTVKEDHAKTYLSSIHNLHKLLVSTSHAKPIKTSVSIHYLSIVHMKIALTANLKSFHRLIVCGRNFRSNPVSALGQKIGMLFPQGPRE